MTRPVARVHELCVSYRGRVAVSGLTGGFARGALTAVIGPNGAGKSSLLGALAGALREVRGRIERPAANRIAWLPQGSTLDPAVPATVAEVVAMGLWSRIGSFRGLDTGARADVARALEATGIAPLARHPVTELSVGQRQRVLFARALLQDAALVLLDEPFAAVDPNTTSALVGLLRRWKDEGRAVVVALHDLALVRAQFDDVLVLSQIAIDWGPVARVMRSGSLERAWARPRVFDAAACAA